MSSHASSDRSGGFPVVATYPVDETGAAGKSWTATQDTDGVMYFGRIGVTTFDGERWRTWPMNGAYALRGLAFGPSGKLWAGASSEVGWFERTDSAWTYRSLVPQLPEEHRNFGELWDAFATGDGAVFVSENKVLDWDGSAFRVWPMVGGGRIRGLRADGQLYVQQRTSGLYTLTASGPKLTLPAASIGDARIWWLERRGSSWTFLTSDGFARLERGVFERFAPATSATIQQAGPTCVVDLLDGRLAVGTAKAGLLIVRRDGTLERVLDRAAGLATELINGLFLDRDRQLWGVSHSFIFRLSLHSATSVFDRRAALPEKPIMQIVPDRDGVIASAEDAVFSLRAGAEQFTAYHPNHELIWDLVQTPAGLLTAGFEGVKRTSDGATRVLHATSEDVFAVEPSRAQAGDYYLAKGAKIVRMDSHGRTEVLAESLPENAATLAEDAEGRIWFGAFRLGVGFVDPGARSAGAQIPPASMGLPRIVGPTVVRATPAGAVLILSAKGGWMLTPRARTFVAISELPHGDIAAMSRAHSSDEVWLALEGTQGRPVTFGRIAIENDRARWQPHEVESLQTIGLPRTILSQKETDGTRVLWIGGTKGILRHVVATGPSAPAPRAPLLRAVAYSAHDGTPAPIGAPLAYSTARIQFEFAAPEFARRAALRLESFIEGIDADWVPAGPESRRELTAVRDGNYHLRVRAVADTGVASPLTSFRFQVLPPWWRTTPVVLGAVLALLPIGYSSVRLRMRALRRRNAELEEKVRQRTEELEAASAAKTQFVANMSHDIRNPLNGIVGLALALEDSRLDHRQREIVATLRECTTYLSTLVDDVLDFASIEAGRVELRPGPFVPGELLSSIVTTLKAETAERGATLSWEADPDLPAHLLGDAGRIQQILVNFATNALKYAGGHIHLSAARPANAPEEIEFAVTDRGPGISEAEQAMLFTKFSRLERTRHDIAGAGLGLAACRLLADIMGGSVGVESSAGTGARFFLRLPLAVAAEAPEPAPSSLPNTTVLLVEDTDYNAWAATAVLARLGLTCDRARTGEEAVRMFGEKRYNVVLLDRNLPDMDGTEVARRIRKLDSDGLQPILLAVTAYCTAEDRTLCLDAGMDAFVGKPLTPDKLRRVLLAAGRRLLAAATVDVPRETAASEIDLTLLNYLSDGTETSIAGHVERFLATMSEGESQLAATLRAGDFSAVEVHAHRVLGQARMVGGTALAEAARQLETAAKARDARTCSECFRRVVEEMRAVTAAMHHRRPAMSTA